nr:immunoglobulin heavy chain junction region [Mus musculus]
CAREETSYFDYW